MVPAMKTGQWNERKGSHEALSLLCCRSSMPKACLEGVRGQAVGDYLRGREGLAVLIAG